MIISSRQISEALHKSTGVKDNVSALAKGLSKYLKSNHLLHLLPNIVRHLEQSENRRAKQNTVFIKSPHELSEGAIQKIKDHTKNWNAEKYVVQIDTSLLGGVVIEGKENHYDASVKQNLQSLKKLLSQQK